MNTLDSRTLGPLNCYIQKITSSGDVMLEAVKASSGFAPIDEEKTVRLKAKALPAQRRGERQGGKQHIVPLKFRNNDFHLEIASKDLQEGDTIIFHADEPKLPAFAVRGTVGDQKFSSTELQDQAVYTHAFGLPGSYEWADANGSGVGGTIHVVSEPNEGKSGADRAIKRMAEGVVVHIVGNKVKPEEVTISTGQTVFFAVEETEGITITDVMLLGKHKRGG